MAFDPEADLPESDRPIGERGALRQHQDLFTRARGELLIVRQLQASDPELFQTFRLMSLQTCPGMFSSSYDREKDLPLTHWEELLADPFGTVFGLFGGAEMVGLTAIYTDRSDPTGETVAVAMSYIREDFRGRGLSVLRYEARLEWARSRPQLKCIRVGHRASNEASRRANQRHGFKLISRSSRVWPDGSQDDHLKYELLLR